MQHVIADLSFRLAHQEQSMHMILSHRQDKGSLDNITKNNLMDASQVQMYMRSMEGGKGTQNGRESYSINERSDQHRPRAKEGEIIKSPASTLSSGTDSVAVNSLRESPMRKRSYKMQ